MVALECSTPMHVHMLPHEGKRHDNIIAHIQIGQTDDFPENCIATLIDMNYLAGGADLRELTLNNQFQTDKRNTTFRCNNLENLGSLAVADSRIMPERLLDILSCSKVYKHMAEIRFKNSLWSPEAYTHIAGVRHKEVQWHAFSDTLQVLFPNLQSLSLPNNNLSMQPDMFPWSSERYHLPRNLSRTKYTDNQYTRPFYLRISPRNYTRVYNLDNNRIKNLTSFGLHGCLEMITMVNNDINTIGEHAFENTSCLQSLRLGYNRIKDLPVGLFKNMTHLHELDLSHNLIETLNETLLDDLLALEILILTQNALTSLPPGLFVNLRRLLYLYLTSNALTSLDSRTFPTNSLSLQKLFVDGNYISSVPGFVFTMKGLVHVSLAHNEITYLLAQYIDDLKSLRIKMSVTFPDNDVEEGATTLPTIDLSNNRIESLVVENITTQVRANLIFLLRNFRIILTDNPINCDCSINRIVSLIQELEMNGKIKASEHIDSNWKCMKPLEQKGRALINVTSNETYCHVPDLNDCPPECECYRRSINQNIIVDCRSRHIKEKIHNQMPEGPLELWYSDNCISELPDYRLMERVIVLNISNNKVTVLSEEFIQRTKNLDTLDIRSNLLTNLPESISSWRKLKVVNLMDNPLKCDCHSKPMKDWIMDNMRIVKHWEQLLCISDKETKLLYETTDADFLCPENSIVYTPLVLGVVALLICVIIVLLYLFRLECKVLLYIYFGLHPFDRKDETMNEVIDCLVVHCHADTDWVMGNIVRHLESPAHRFVVFDNDRDFLLGYSIHENLTNMVRHSKRIIICLSADWNPSNVGFKLVWNSAVKKIKETRSNYGIVICKGMSKSTIKDKSLRKYIKWERFINSTERLFIPKIVYAMPSKSRIKRRNCDDRDITYPDVHQNIYPTVFEKLTEESSTERQAGEYDVFISNSYDNDEYVICTLLPILEDRGYKLCIAERDFLAGPTKEENILTAVYRSRRTLFILSRRHWSDEWSLFTYKKAYERSLREKNNHLMVIVTDDDIDILDKEIKCYLNGHVTLNVKDTRFYNKLFSGLPILQKQRSVSINLGIEDGGIDNECYRQDGGLLENDELAETNLDE